ncbi:MAG: NAD(P)H-quinone oxidoreductase [Candidatus Eremiobacteraeota bacterium]|nr:NAD(P)H-quinone oxidoreductase [Candidatus Eremiobacteraeota bacterium]
MRAIVYEGTGDRNVIFLRDVDEPVAGTDDALVAIAFAGLNRADVLERQGHYAAQRSAVMVPGLEFSGVVQTVGSNVKHLAAGDRVCGLVTGGAHAALVVAQAATLAKVPDGVSLRDAAAIPEAFLTAHDALFTRGDFRLGQTALVHAVGSSVGLAALGLISCAGGIAIGTSRTPEKLTRAQSHGLTFGFLLDDEWLGRVHAATNARGADVILDFIGAPILDRNVAALAAGGRIVQIGTLGGAKATFDLGPLMAKRGALIGTVLRTRPLEEKIVLAKHLERTLLPLFASGKLRTEIDRVYAIGDMRDAHERMESDGNFGKILLEIDAA